MPTATGMSLTTSITISGFVFSPMILLACQQRPASTEAVRGEKVEPALPVPGPTGRILNQAAPSGTLWEGWCGHQITQEFLYVCPIH